MDGLGIGGTGRRGGRSRRAASLVAVLALLSLMLVALTGLPALADDITDPPTTTEPAPDTTPPPDTTPDTVPDTTPPTDPPPETTVPTDPTTDPTSTTDPATTTEPDTTTTTEPGGDKPLLLPAEMLVPLPEFAALSAHERALVEQVQRATDAYALHRYAQVDLAHKLAAARDALDAARAVERDAATREILGLAESSSSDAAPRVAGHGRSRRAAVNHQLDAFHELQHQLAAARKDARRARVRAQSAFADVNAQYTEQSKAVDDATAERKAAESDLEDELGSDAVRARPDGITATLQAAQAGQPDPIIVGGIKSPIPGAKLASPFGLRNDPLSGGAGFHPGIDLAATAGTPILAAADGVVVTAGDCGGYGNCVVIDHGVSIATLYGHQSQVAVSVGEHVAEGQVIGYVGSTGLSTGPHLHFEVRVHGLPTDPLLALVPA